MESEVRIGKEVINLANQIKRKIGKESAEYGITSIQGRIIGFLYWEASKRDIFQKDIETEFNIRRSSVTSVLQLMEKNELIKRVSVSEDARLKKIILTEKGVEIQEHVHKCIDKLEKELSEGFTDDEINVFLHFIERVSKKIRE